MRADLNSQFRADEQSRSERLLGLDEKPCLFSCSYDASDRRLIGGTLEHKGIRSANTLMVRGPALPSIGIMRRNLDHSQVR